MKKMAASTPSNRGSPSLKDPKEDSFNSVLASAQNAAGKRVKVDLDDGDSIFATPSFQMAAAPKTRMSSGGGNQATATIHGLVISINDSTITGAMGQPLQKRDLNIWVSEVESRDVQDALKGAPEYFLLPTTSEAPASGEKRVREVKLEAQFKVRQLVGTVIRIGFFLGDDKKGPGAKAAFAGSRVTVKNVVAAWSMRDNVPKVYLNANGNIVNVNNERVHPKHVDAFVINELSSGLSQSISCFNASHIYGGYFDPELTCRTLGVQTLDPSQEAQVAGVQRMWSDNKAQLVASLRSKSLQIGGDIGDELQNRAGGIEAMPINELASGEKTMFMTDVYDHRVAALTSKGIAKWAPAPEAIKNISDSVLTKVIASKIKRYDLAGNSLDLEVLVMLCPDVAAAKKAVLDTQRPDAGFLIPKHSEETENGSFVVPSASVIATQSCREMARKFSVVEKPKLEMVIKEVIPYVDFAMLVKCVPSDGSRVVAAFPLNTFMDLSSTIKRVAVAVSEQFVKTYLLDGAASHVPDGVKEGVETYELPKDVTTFPVLEADGYQNLTNTPFKFSSFKSINKTYHVIFEGMSDTLLEKSKEQREAGGNPVPAATIDTVAGEALLKSFVAEGEDCGDWIKEACLVYACA